jgi:uncharacterized protein YndB with AHSA1/START domain
MKNAGALQVTTPTDREIAMTRVFDAPRGLVFEALTKPELLKRWLGVFRGWELAVCEIDLRVGGRYRYEWWRADGSRMGMGGVYREIVPSERIVQTERFDVSWYEGEAIETTVLDEHAGRTTLTTTVLYQSRAVRDGVLESGMEDGVAAGYDNLAEILAASPAREPADRTSNSATH